MSPSASKLRSSLASTKPACVIFDGASGFLKWRHNWRSSDWLVLLDRTDLRCLDGATAVNDEYESRSLALATELSSVPRPESVELTAFYGRRT